MQKVGKERMQKKTNIEGGKEEYERVEYTEQEQGAVVMLVVLSVLRPVTANAAGAKTDVQRATAGRWRARALYGR